MKKITLVAIYIRFLAVVGLVIILFQNLFGWKEAYLIKEISVLFILLYGIKYFKNAKIKYIYIELILIFGALFLGVINANKYDFSFFASIRQFLIPYIFILIGYLYSNRMDDNVKVNLKFLSTVLLLCLFGFFERFTYLWEIFDVTPFFTEKNIPVYEFGYPNFWIEPIVYEGLTKYTEGTPRMVSSIMDPVNLGHILVAAIVLILYDRSIILEKKYKASVKIIMLAALVLTFSKGALLHLFICFLILSKISKFFKIFFIVLAAFAILIYITEHAGFLVHWLGFINVFNHLTLAGSGFGSYGNVSILYGESVSSEVGDSYWAALLGQLGLIGFLMWIFSWYIIIRKVKINKPISIILIGQLMVAALSENAFNFMSVSFLMILLGIKLNESLLLEKNKRKEKLC